MYMDIFLQPYSDSKSTQYIEEFGTGLDTKSLKSQLNKNASIEELQALSDGENIIFSANKISKFPVTAGDILILYTGNEEFTYYGKIERVENTKSICSELFERETGYAFVLESLNNISISGEYMSKCGNWDANYIIGFTRLHDKSKIIEDFGSVETFLNNAKSGIQ